MQSLPSCLVPCNNPFFRAFNLLVKPRKNAGKICVIPGSWAHACRSILLSYAGKISLCSRELFLPATAYVRIRETWENPGGSPYPGDVIPLSGSPHIPDSSNVLYGCDTIFSDHYPANTAGVWYGPMENTVHFFSIDESQARGPSARVRLSKVAGLM